MGFDLCATPAQKDQPNTSSTELHTSTYTTISRCDRLAV
jgi:hypothetical protein